MKPEVAVQVWAGYYDFVGVVVLLADAVFYESLMQKISISYGTKDIFDKLTERCLER